MELARPFSPSNASYYGDAGTEVHLRMRIVEHLF